MLVRLSYPPHSDLTLFMNPFASMDYNNWYVLSTRPGLESKLKKSIEVLVGDPVTLYLPRRELCHRIKGEFQIVTKPLFPGYVFIYKELDDLLAKTHHSPLEKHLHPVRYNNTLAMVREDEMAFIIKLAGINGLVKASQAIISEDHAVTIVDGPLKNLTGKILYINSRKRKAKIVIDVLCRQVTVTLGLEMLQSKQRKPYELKGNNSIINNHTQAIRPPPEP